VPAIILICRRCRRSSPAVRYWAASDLCAVCADQSLQNDPSAEASVRLPRLMLLQLLNSVGAAAALLTGQIPREASAEVGNLLMLTIDAYRKLAADGGAPTPEQIAEEFEAAGATEAAGGPAQPRLWRPGDPIG
jgi:hypothetical protein